MIESFLKFCRTPNQRFVCADAGDDNGPRFTASIEHRLGEPAGAQAIRTLNKRLGDLAAQFEPFFQAANGAVLYADTRSESAGVVIAAIEDWDELTREWKAWHEGQTYYDPDAEEDDDFDLDAEPPLPAWMKNAVAIGEAPQSGNYFALALDGDERGNIYYCDHETLQPEHYASSLNELLARFIWCDPPRMLMHLGGFARYADGKTDQQWIPEQYLTGGAA
jgi:hypothetical protein